MIKVRIAKILGWLVISLALFMMLCRVTLTYFLPHESEWGKYIQSNFKYPITVQSTKFTFQGYLPVLNLHGVDIFNEEKRLALTINHAKMVLNPVAMLFKHIELNQLTIDGMKVRVQYEKDTGIISLPDLSQVKWDPRQQSADPVFRVKKLQIKDSDVHFILQDKSIPLAEINLAMDDAFPKRVRGKMAVLNMPGSIIEFSMDFPAFGRANTKIYLDWQNASLEQVASLWPKSIRDEFKKGQADLKTWITFTRKGKTEFTSDVILKDGALAEGKIWLFGRGKEKNWKVSTHWSPENVERSYEAFFHTYECQDAQCYLLKTWNVDLHHLSDQMETFSLIPEEYKTRIKTLGLSGMVSSASLFLVQHDAEWIPVEGKVQFNDVSMVGEKNNSSFRGLSGKLYYQEGTITLDLNSQNTLVEYHPWFLSPIKIDEIQSRWQWIPTNDPKVEGIISTLKLNNTNFSGNLSFDHQNGHIEQLDLSVEGTQWPIQEGLSFLPSKIMDSTLKNWLDKSIKSGHIQQSQIRFNGRPSDFPFDNQEGLFEAKLQLENIQLDYDDEWPALENLHADLIFRNREMQVNAHQANIADGPLVSTTAKISDLGASIAVLYVDSKIQNKLENGMAVIAQSPLKNGLGKTLSALDWEGGFDLDLSLEVPLTQKPGHPVKVKGCVGVLDAKVSVPDWQLQAEEVKGQVSFTQDIVSSENLTGKLFNHDTLFKISTLTDENDSHVELQIQGHIEYEHLEKWLNFPDYDFITGSSDYLAMIAIPPAKEHHPLQIKVQTLLNGIEINAPFPFNKKANTEKLFSFLLEWEPHQYAQIQAEYEKKVSLSMRLNADNDKEWKLAGAHVNLGALALAKPREDGIFLIDGYLDEFNFSEWKKLALEGPSHSLSFEPLIALNVGKLMIEGETFSKTHVDAQWDKAETLWTFNFNGPSLKGHVVLPEGDDNREIVLDLKRLTLARNEGSDKNSWLENPSVIQRPIDIKIKKFKYNEKLLTDFQARIEPSWKGYDFPRVNAKLKNTDITLSGQWDVLSHRKQVVAEGKIITKNTSDLLKTLGFQGTVHHAKGEVDFSLNWQGNPFKIDYATLVGKAAFHLSNGTVQGVDPGLGRVLNLLSLDTVQRRLNFDFSDVTQKGFAFDEFDADFQFGKGKVSSNKVSLKGPSANIESYGQADLENQEISGIIIMMPNVTGSLPVAAAIAAGNPAVGAAVWLVDKMVGKKIQEIHRYRYRLVGTWDSPKLETIPQFPISRG